MQLYSSGADAAEIRRSIEAKFRPLFPTMTPTPPVDAGK
jgi:hypothetical protein